MKKLLPLLVLLASACSPSSDNPETLVNSTSEVVYGDDDRTDYYAESDDSLKTLTHESIVAMMDRSNINLSDPNNARFPNETLESAMGLCPGERFADQITAGSCSATLIDNDLILTAGHCMTSQSECNSSAFVFNYYMVSETELQTVTENDVYNCAELVVQELSDGATQLDYAIARLDRPVVGHSPATFNTSPSPVTEGDSVTVVGFGSGLPAKIDDGGSVLDARSSTLDFFSATTDTFGGNSGSGVFDADNELIGILVRGDQDYYYDRDCARVNEFPETGGGMGGEGITYAYQAINALCAEGYPSERLCNTTSECGDGFCSFDEDLDSCPDDCTVPDDPMEDWTCDPDYFGTQDGCDCDCGIRDPDCDRSDQEVFNCNDGETCNENGECGNGDISVPNDWYCEPDAYGTRDGCDCECGTFDPDCDTRNQEHNTCDDDEYCSDEDGGICLPNTPDPDTGVDPDTGGNFDAGSTDTNTPDAGGDSDDQNTQDPELEDDADRPGAGGTDCSTAPTKANPFWIAGFMGLLAWRRRKNDQ